MSDENETVRALIMDRADRIKGSEEHANHIKKFLDDWCGINSDAIPVDVFKICAVDAMIYDVGLALDSLSWKDRDRRKEMLKEIFPKPLPKSGE